MNLQSIQFANPPSHLQMDFYEWVESGTGSVMLRARAGTGKTTTIMDGLQIIPPTDPVIVLAFNRHIAAELKKRNKLPNVTIKTLHGVGYAALQNLKPHLNLEERKSFKTITTLMNLSKEDRNIYIRFIMRLLSCGKNAGVGVQSIVPDEIDSWDDLIDHFDLEIEAKHMDQELLSIQRAAKGNNEVVPIYGDLQTAKAIQLTRSLLQLSNEEFRRKGIIDYDDMIYLPLIYHARFDKYKYVLCDEAQDINRVQQEIIFNLMDPDSRFVGVGDDAQCQPAGTMIQTTGGLPYPIEHLYVGQELASFDSHNSKFVGFKNQGRKIKNLAKRYYKGPIYTIQAGTKKSKSTLEHKWFVRLNSDKTVGKYIIYLMMKDNFARIGTTRLTLEHGAFGLSNRCRQEHADKAWILSVVDSKKKAFIQEQIISANYGITDMCFQPASGQPLPKFIDHHQNYLDAIHTGIGDSTEKVLRCLSNFGRDINFPLYKREDDTGKNATHFGKYSFITEACNLLDNVMEAKIFDGNIHSKLWESINVTKTYEECYVYSIELDEREWYKAVYISDGIVTHNSIYAFRGADENAMENLKKRFNCAELPLTISYRCPKSVITEAKKFVPDIEPWDLADLGKVEILRDFNVKIFKRGDAILCRTNAPLLDMFYWFAKHGIGVKILGKDIAAGLVNLIGKVPTDDIEILRMVLKEYVEKECKRLLDKGKEDKIARIREKLDCIEFIISNSPTVKTVSDLILTIEGMFTDDPAGSIILSTVHKSKGMEYDDVYILNRYLFNSKFATQDWQKKQEQNLHYVAITRAKKALYYIDSKNKLIDVKEAV